MKRKIADIKVGPRFRQELGDVESLAKSIREVGLLHPIVITKEGELIAGQRRLEACKYLELTEIDVNVVDLDDPIRGEYTENTERKEFTESEAVSIWKSLESRQGQKPLPTDSVRSDPPKVKASKLTGKSPDTLSKTNAILKAAEENPEKYGNLKSRLEAGEPVSRLYKELKKAAQLPTDSVGSETDKIHDEHPIELTDENKKLISERAEGRSDSAIINLAIAHYFSCLNGEPLSDF